MSWDRAVAKLEEDHQKALRERNNLLVGSWRGDEALKLVMNEISTLSKNINVTVTNLATLRKIQPVTDAGVKAAEEELAGYVNAIPISYENLLGSENISQHLLDNIYPFIRALLVSISVLFSPSTTEEGSAAGDVSIDSQEGLQPFKNYSLGMVWSACRHLEKLPISNKAAYRRKMMEAVLTTKETVEEIRAAVANEGETEEDYLINYDEYFDSNDVHAEVYSQDEVELVRGCILTMNVFKGKVSEAIQIMTSFAETVPRGDSRDGQMLIGQLVRIVDKGRYTVVDLGAELESIPLDFVVIKAAQDQIFSCTTEIDQLTRQME